MKNIKREFITGICAIAMMILASANLTAQDVQSQNNQNQNQDVVEVIQSNDDLTTFAELLEEANKIEELRQGTNLTIIAPTNQAFEDMQSELDQLRQNPQELEAFIDSHIKNGSEMGQTQGMSQGQEQGMGQQGQAQNRDEEPKEIIQASNGEVHVVDKVKKDYKKDKNKDRGDYEN
ncbi:MAG: fasciclin domain-containing protein [Balneolaceae bacterium]